MALRRISRAALPRGHSLRSLTVPFMIAPETLNHIENIKKRAGHLWRFL
jgi:hypothetical protein